MMVARGSLALPFFGLALGGAILPLSAFLPWLGDHGFDPVTFIGELFSTRIGGFFGWDVIVSAIATILFITVQGRRDRVRFRWLAILTTLTIGVSCGLPLFLGLRERALRAIR